MDSKQRRVADKIFHVAGVYRHRGKVILKFVELINVHKSVALPKYMFRNTSINPYHRTCRINVRQITKRSVHPHNTAPPLILITSPVICRDQSDARKTIDKAISSAVATRLSGMPSTTLFTNSGSSNTPSFKPVSTHPGATAFTRMLGASSFESAFVNDICPPFEAA